MLDICHHVVSPLHEYDAGFRALDFIFFLNNSLFQTVTWHKMNQFRYYFFFFLGGGRRIIVLELWVVAPGKETSFCIILNELVFCAGEN